MIALALCVRGAYDSHIVIRRLWWWSWMATWRALAVVVVVGALAVLATFVGLALALASLWDDE